MDVLVGADLFRRIVVLELELVELEEVVVVGEWWWNASVELLRNVIPFKPPPLLLFLPLLPLPPPLFINNRPVSFRGTRASCTNFHSFHSCFQL